MKQLLCMLAAACFFSSVATAQHLEPKQLEGYWRQRMDIVSDGTVRGAGNDDPIAACLLKITTTNGNDFSGNFEQCGYDRYLTGTLYNGKLFNAVLYGNSGEKYVYCGKVTPEGKLVGNYFTPNCLLYGDFEWEKVKVEQESFKNTYVLRDGMNAQELTEANGWHVIDNRDALVVTTAPPTLLPDAPWKETVPVYTPPSPEPAPEVMARPVEVAKYSVVTSPAKTTKPQPIVQEATKKMDICDNTADPNAVHTRAKTHGRKVVENGKTYHLVGKGETMFCIASHYKMSIEQLAELNDKLCEHLKEGEKLLVIK